MGTMCFSSKDAVIESPRNPSPNSQKSRVDTKDRAILDLKRRKRDCEDYLKKMEVKIADSLSTAKKFAKTKDKSKALFAMKLKKMYEKTKDKIMGMSTMLDTSIMNVEQAKMDVDVYQALKQGDEVLKDVRNVSVEDFEEIYENQQERNKIAEYMANEVIREDEYAEDLQKLESQLEEVDEGKDAAKVQMRLEGDDLSAPTGKIEAPAAPAAPAKKEVADDKKEPLLA